MNNERLADGTAFAAVKKKKEFFKAQNRIAYLMFILLLCELLASFALIIIEMIVPRPFENSIIKEAANAIVYVFYMLTPSLVYFALSKKGEHVKHEKPKHPHTLALFVFGLGIVYAGQLVSFLMATVFSGVGIDLNAATELNASADPVLLIIQIFEIAFLPAVLEELLARHIILTELLRYGRGFAVMISALLFSLMHMNPIQMPFAFIAGLVMAYMTVATGSVIPSFFLHFVNNALSVVLTFLPEFTDEKTTFIADAAVTVGILAAGAAAGIYLFCKKRKEKEAEAVEGSPVLESFAAESPAAETPAEETQTCAVCDGADEADEEQTADEPAGEESEPANPEEKSEKVNVLNGIITKNLSPAMIAYIISALVCTILTFLILWGYSELPAL